MKVTAAHKDDHQNLQQELSEKLSTKPTMQSLDNTTPSSNSIEIDQHNTSANTCQTKGNQTNKTTDAYDQSKSNPNSAMMNYDHKQKGDELT